ncbi:MAG: hypothetical protein ACMXYF_05465 [Candidatus Woesearchaeota archaeon]
MEKTAPQKKFSAGLVSATVWENTRVKNGMTFPVKTISLQKAYKDKDGSWKTVHSFHVNDIPKAKLVLEKAYEYLSMQEVQA